MARTRWSGEAQGAIGMRMIDNSAMRSTMNESDPIEKGSDARLYGLAIYLFVFAGMGVGAIVAYLQDVHSWVDAKSYLVSFGDGGAIVAYLIHRRIAKPGRSKQVRRNSSTRPVHLYFAPSPAGG